jgi:ribosomal protein L7/L12
METIIGTIVGIIIVAIVAKLLLKSSSKGISGNSSVPENISEEDVKNLVRQGKKIEAIKCYRAMTGLGLKEAKDAIDKMAV